MIAEQRIIPVLGGIRLDRLSGRRAVVARRAGGQRADDPPLPRGPAPGPEHRRPPARPRPQPRGRRRAAGRRHFRGDPLTADEARQLLEATKGDRLHALWRLAIITGYRQGELLGLGWDDVDLEGGFVTITRAARASRWRVDPRGHEDKPEAADRAGPATVDVLRAHQLRQAADRTADWQFWGLAFVTPAGMPWGRSELLRAFHAACESAGVRRRRFHDLRGSSATLLADIGIDESVRMSRLGHVTKAMARHYAHPSEAQDRIASDRLAEAIGG
jgi:integrase